MTIDERIISERQMAEYHKLNRETCKFNNECSECATGCEAEEKEHEQLAEWLEELKKYKEENYTERLVNAVAKTLVEAIENITIEDVNMYKVGYNKAIDEFVNAIKTSQDAHLWCCSDHHLGCCNGDNCDECLSDFGKQIDKIAEQLKGCEKDEK